MVAATTYMKYHICFAAERKTVTPVDFYKCLAEQTRLQCLLLLVQHRELCVCELVAALALSQPKISRHLAQLRECQLVETHRRGKWMYYRLSPTMPNWMRQVLQVTARVSDDEMALPLQRLQALGGDCC